MTHAEAVARWLKVDGIGVEIGAGQTPVPGIDAFYVDRFAEYAGAKCRADFWGDAGHLPFHDCSLDYVVSSHVLEHAANPVAALVEWDRVLRHHGIIYAVVPNRRATFDHLREPTRPEHLWDDYERGVNQTDGTHIDEFVDQVDWSRYRPELSPADIPEAREALRELYRSAPSRGGEINIHFHVFEPANLLAFIELAARRLRRDWRILALHESFPADCPNGILLVIRVHKSIQTRMRAWFRSRHARRNRLAVVRPDAQPIHADEEMRRRH